MENNNHNSQDWLWFTILAAVIVLFFGLIAFNLIERNGAIDRPDPPENGHTVGGPTSPENDHTSTECIKYTEARNYINQTTCVEGRVDHVFVSSSNNAFINFCPDFRTCSFSSVIFSEDLFKFSDIQSIRGQTVEIEGKITTYEGRPQIVIDSPSQLTVSQ